MISIKKISRTIIELVFNNGNTIVRDDITDLNGYVNKSLISDLRNIADELENHNTKMDELNGVKLES